MALLRDWTSTLWAASYMGVPFYFERDESEGGRSLEVHQFFDADNPEVQDLGRRPRFFSGTAYVTGNDADTQAVSLEQIFETKGPGQLVIPIMGPVSVHCSEFKRIADKDKFGYIAFTVKFVRDGTAAAQTSVPLLGQQVFDSSDAVAWALASLFPDALVLSNPANYVIAAAVNEVLSVVAAIETVRTTNPIDPDISAQVAAADAALVIAAPLLITSPPVLVTSTAVMQLQAATPSPALNETFTDPTAILAAAIVATIRLLADGMEDTTDAGSGALLLLASYFPAPAASTSFSPNAISAAANGAAIVNLARVAALTAWCEALERQTYSSRPDGVAARAAAAEQLGIEFGNWTGAAGWPVYTSLQDLQGSVVQYLTQLITNLAPVVTVTSPQSMPSLWWAWRLYQDPRRAIDLTLRNSLPHPSFVPTSFEALAPGYPAPASLPTEWPSPG